MLSPILSHQLRHRPVPEQLHRGHGPTRRRRWILSPINLLRNCCITGAINSHPGAIQCPGRDI